jgi:hypothetical protein
VAQAGIGGWEGLSSTNGDIDAKSAEAVRVWPEIQFLIRRQGLTDLSQETVGKWIAESLSKRRFDGLCRTGAHGVVLSRQYRKCD